MGESLATVRPDWWPAVLNENLGNEVLRRIRDSTGVVSRKVESLEFLSGYGVRRRISVVLNHSPDAALDYGESSTLLIVDSMNKAKTRGFSLTTDNGSALVNADSTVTAAAGAAGLFLYLQEGLGPRPGVPQRDYLDVLARLSIYLTGCRHQDEAIAYVANLDLALRGTPLADEVLDDTERDIRRDDPNESRPSLREVLSRAAPVITEIHLLSEVCQAFAMTFLVLAIASRTTRASGPIVVKYTYLGRTFSTRRNELDAPDLADLVHTRAMALRHSENVATSVPVREPRRRRRLRVWSGLLGLGEIPIDLDLPVSPLHVPNYHVELVAPAGVMIAGLDLEWPPWVYQNPWRHGRRFRTGPADAALPRRDFSETDQDVSYTQYAKAQTKLTPTAPRPVRARAWMQIPSEGLLTHVLVAALLAVLLGAVGMVLAGTLPGTPWPDVVRLSGPGDDWYPSITQSAGAAFLAAAAAVAIFGVRLDENAFTRYMFSGLRGLGFAVSGGLLIAAVAFSMFPIWPVPMIGAAACASIALATLVVTAIARARAVTLSRADEDELREIAEARQLARGRGLQAPFAHTNVKEGHQLRRSFRPTSPRL